MLLRHNRYLERCYKRSGQPASYGCTPSQTGVSRLDESNPFVRTGGKLVAGLLRITMRCRCQGMEHHGWDFHKCVWEFQETPTVQITSLLQTCGPDAGGTTKLGTPTGMYLAVLGRLVSEHEDSDVNGSGHNDGNDQGRNH